MLLKAMPARLGTAPERLRSLPKQAEGFYHSSEWRSLMADLKAIRGNHCERCGSDYRVIGDHKVERKDGGAELDADNVELLCIRCHNRKTAKAKAKRASAPIA